MPKSNTPYDPQPERDDALGELAREGYQAVPGDHAARLKSLQDRLGLPGEGISAPKAVVRTMRPRRWLAIAAGVAALVVAGMVLFTYDGADQQFAKVVESVEQGEIPSTTTANESHAADDLSEQELEKVSFNDKQAPVDAVEMPEPELQVINPVVNRVEEIAEPMLGLESVSSGASPSSASKETQAPAPPSAKSEQAAVVVAESTANTPAEGAAKAKKQSSLPDADADMVSEEVEEAVKDDVASSFRMERAAVVATREITGEVLEPSGVPVIGAVLMVEETGQQVITDQKGEFTIMVGSDAVVGNLTATGYNTLMFDLTKGEEYRLYMPRVASSLPTAQLKGKEIALRLIAPKASPYAAFDAYIAQKSSSFKGETVTVQFEINRFGRPRQIVTGPGSQNRSAVKKLKEWLKNGPDWPAEYQRKSWRYTVILP